MARLMRAVIQRTLLLSGLMFPFPEYTLQKNSPRRLIVITTNMGLYLFIHAPRVTLARPKLASTIFICHINALIRAEARAPVLVIEHFI